MSSNGSSSRSNFSGLSNTYHFLKFSPSVPNNTGWTDAAPGAPFPLSEPTSEAVEPTGISTTEAFGTPVVAGPVTATGIPTAEAFGTATITSDAVLYPTGIPSSEALGTPTLAGPITALGIPTAEAFGTASIQHVLVPTGIISQEAFGAVSLTQSITLTGIPTAEAFGTAQLAGPINPPSIASAEAFGTATVATLIEPIGILTAEVFGTATIATLVAPVGIASAEAFGTPILAGPITVTGIPSSAAIGTPTVIAQALLAPTSIPSGEAFGTADLRHAIIPSSIASTEAFGSATVVTLLQVNGIATAEAFGTPIVVGPILVTGIASAQAFGTPSVAHEVDVQAFGGSTALTGTADGGSELTLIGSELDMSGLHDPFDDGVIDPGFWTVIDSGSGQTNEDGFAHVLRMVTGTTAGSIAGLRTVATSESIDVEVTFAGAGRVGVQGRIAPGALTLYVGPGTIATLAQQVSGNTTGYRMLVQVSGKTTFDQFVPNAALVSTFRLQRVGSTLRFYVGGSFIVAASWVADVASVQLSAANDAALTSEASCTILNYLRKPVIVVGEEPATVIYARSGRVVAVAPEAPHNAPAVVPVTITGRSGIGIELDDPFVYTLGDRASISRRMTLLTDSTLRS